MAVSTIPDPYKQPTALVKAAPSATAPANFALRRTIEAHADVIAPLCPPGVNVETVIAQLWAVCQKTPQVAQATPQSLIIGLSLGVQTGGVLGSDWYLLPFKTNGKYEVTFAFDYKFLAACIVQAGGARSITAEVVRKNDTFRVIKGTSPRIEHEEPALGKERGPIIGFYAVAHLGHSVPPKFFVMTLEEVEKIRAKSKQWNPEKIGKICPDWYGMARVVHRIGKLLPKRPNARMQALEQIMDSDARVDAAEEVDGVITTLPDRPAHMDADGVDHSDETPDGQEEQDDDRVTVALDVALEIQVGKNKTPLGAYSNDGLHKLVEWAREKSQDGDESGRLARIIAACDTILEARATGEITEPVKGAA